MPGFTHLQQAQPILLAHYWLSLFFLLEREKSRLHHARLSTDIMPLGSGALAGSGFNVDRGKLAEDLGFASASLNSIDAVSSRDFLLETLSSIASISIHLSVCRDLLIWSSREFGLWSSMMLDDRVKHDASEEKSDSLELIRGKSGRFIGNYTDLQLLSRSRIDIL
jgi:argininosuccinate lyase